MQRPGGAAPAEVRLDSAKSDQGSSTQLLIGHGAVAGFGLLGVVLCAVWASNFLLFHTISELFSVVVSFSAAVVAWYSRDWTGRNFLFLLGLSCLFVGVIDAFHIIAYKGINILPDSGGNLSSQLWLSARVLEAGNFLVAVWAPRRRYHLGALLAVETVVTVALLAAAFGNVWPPTFVEGQGVTPVKTAVELVLAAAFLLVLVRLRRHVADFDPAVHGLLVAAVAMKMATELAFSWYVDLFGLVNFIGHCLKIIGVWLLLRAVVDSGLRRPQSLIVGAMERERSLSNEAARHAQTLDAVLDATLDPVVMFHADGRIRFVSSAAERFFERGTRELVGRTWREAGLPEAVMLRLEGLTDAVLAEGAPRTEEFCVPWRGGPLCLECQVAPVDDDQMPHAAAVAVLRDITARKAMEESLKSSLEDNRVLVQEVHHRVKNNLQIVSSILQMQGWQICDPTLRRHFEEGCGRILSLAMVHELLYRQQSPASVDFTALVRALCAEVFRLHDLREDRVALTVEVSAALSVEQAEPLALIMHELVADAVKNAFADGAGRLRVRLSCPAPGEGVLVVADQGANADRPMSFDEQSGTLGLRMVGSLVRQLRGNVSVHRGQGVEVRVHFPLVGVPSS
ncbi:MAG: PAS domain-containing protein [Magnetospirillum sp.]|nr:PAS domain-containing protein [Magnetospirillum sp.]